MWAISTLSCRFWHPAGATTTGNHRPVTVPARYSRPRKNLYYDYEDEDEETEIDRELELLKQQEIGDTEAFSPNSSKISGSAVLLALQKASAQKTSKKTNKKKTKNTKNEDDKRQNQGDAIVDYSKVKPLCIKSDWKDRLDELEKQLHQLIHDT